MNFCNIFFLQAIACAVEYDDQHCGIYAGDADSYKDFAEVFDPLICEYHGLDADFAHTSDMDSSKLKVNFDYFLDFRLYCTFWFIFISS